MESELFGYVKGAFTGATQDKKGVFEHANGGTVFLDEIRTLIAKGMFREDLYYRLSMVEIELPRLLDRKEDLPILQRYFLQKFAQQYGKALVGITRRAQVRLASYDWPGNVRELENVIGRAAMMTDGNIIDVKDLPENLHALRPDLVHLDDCLVSMEEVQRRHLTKVLDRLAGNKARAAEILGISRNTIYEMLAKIKSSGNAVVMPRITAPTPHKI